MSVSRLTTTHFTSLPTIIMAPTSLEVLTNPLLTSQQLLQFKNSSTDETTSLNFVQSVLTNSAGILLRLPQEVIATSLVLLQRYQILSTSKATRAGSPSRNFTAKTNSAAIVYLTAKLSFTPLSPRSVINVYAYLTSQASPLWFINSPESQKKAKAEAEIDSKAYYVSEGTYAREKLELFAAESQILTTLGFDTHVALPHSLALTYMQALGVSSPALAERVFELLNGGLLSPQLLYLTHQPNELAVGAVYLAAREEGVKLVEENWWEVLDVERESLGFLVLGLGSLEGFAKEERRKVIEGGTERLLLS